MNRPVTNPGTTCRLCSREIPAGESYPVYQHASDGTVWRECAHCDAIRELAAIGHDHTDGYDEHVISLWMPVGEAYQRLKALWAAKWAAPDGTLCPVPEKIFRVGVDGTTRQVAVQFPNGAVSVVV